jgi:hypothetical protein
MMNQLTPSTNVARYSFSINHTIYLTHWIPNGHYVVLMYFLYTLDSDIYIDGVTDKNCHRKPNLDEITLKRELT